MKLSGFYFTWAWRLLCTSISQSVGRAGYSRIANRVASPEKRDAIARQGAEHKLRNELKDTVTALLLSCEIALQVPTLSSAAEVKLRAVDTLARAVQKIGVQV